LSDILIAVCWQVWIVVREEIAVAVNKGCHYVGLKKQRLGYHNSWDCWYFSFLVRFLVLHCVDVGNAY
jgi:hypothetical protein